MVFVITKDGIKDVPREKVDAVIKESK